MRSLLLDSHVLLWALLDPDRLGASARSHIESPDSNVYVSPVSAWEIEIKRALGKLDVPDDLEAQLKQQRFTEWPLRLRHVAALSALPPLHRDPFDRMLIAQASCDDLVLVTHDAVVQRYPIKTLAAG